MIKSDKQEDIFMRYQYKKKMYYDRISILMLKSDKQEDIFMRYQYKKSVTSEIFFSILGVLEY